MVGEVRLANAPAVNHWWSIPLYRSAREGRTGELVVADVRPWRPGEGYLYELQVELRAADGSVVDAYPVPVGIRTERIEGTRFLINGQPFYFKGFGKHEDTAVGQPRRRLPGPRLRPYGMDRRELVPSDPLSVRRGGP